MKASDNPIVLTYSFDCPSSTLWQALTDPAIMCQWYFDVISDFKPEVGFKTEFTVTADSDDFTHQWLVTEVTDQSLISYEWTFAGYPGKSLSSFALQSTEQGCLLTLTITVLEDFPDGVPEFDREACVGGWNYLIGENLTPLLHNP